jgi:hypothetical protein
LTSVLDYVMTRPRAERKPLDVFVDEAAVFPAVALARALAEGRKFGLHLFVANQSMSQLDEELVDALNANAGRIMFRLGLRDAHLLAPLMGVSANDLTGLANLHAVVQVPGQSAFSVRFDPPSNIDELPRYEVPQTLSHEAGAELQEVVRREPGSAPTEPGDGDSEELWAKVIERIACDGAPPNPRRNMWLHSVVATRIKDDRFEVAFENDFVRDWFSEYHLGLVQAAVTDLTRGDPEVIARAGRET